MLVRVAERQMIYGLDGAPMHREGTRAHWDLYRRAIQERPILLANLEHEIQLAVDAQLNVSTAINSSWLGSELLQTFAHRQEWNAFVPDLQQSRSLFGMIMWTVLFDDSRDWVFTMIHDARSGEEQRVYILRSEEAA